MTSKVRKIGVSFAVEGKAADDAIHLNAVIAQSFDSQIRLGAGNNSDPHVTIALGEADQAALATIIELVKVAVRRTEQFRMSFGPVTRETVTGRYVLADAVIPEHVAIWRSHLRAQIVGHLSGVSRTTDDPHLTVAVVDGQEPALDQFLARQADRLIAECRVTHVDVAQAGPRGAKGSLIERFTLSAA